MSIFAFSQAEFANAVKRGVRQCVVIASQPNLSELWRVCKEANLKLFALGEAAAETPGTFVPTTFASESLPQALDKAEFDRKQPTLFVWLGGAGYRTMESVISSLSFMASLPSGSGVVFDYIAERASLAAVKQTALDALASHVPTASGLRYLIQPTAVNALLRGVGFHHINDAQLDGAFSGHFVSATV